MSHEDWDHCDFATATDLGERRIRVVKGTEKIEGFGRHLKHSSAGIPEEVGSSDERLNLYAQGLCWRAQTCGAPLRDVLQTCSSFRDLPHESKLLVFRYGLKRKGKAIKRGDKAHEICLELPKVVYADAPAFLEGEDDGLDDEGGVQFA